eukprot:189211-Lingulodinium_polyedra.AAC.1
MRSLPARCSSPGVEAQAIRAASYSSRLARRFMALGRSATGSGRSLARGPGASSSNGRPTACGSRSREIFQHI